MFQKLKCKLGKHNWITIGRNAEYYTVYVDHNDFKKYWVMSFYQCSCCGKRKYTDNYDSFGKHNGMHWVKMNWLEVGILPENTTQFNNPILRTKKTKAKVLKFTLINGDKK